MIKSFKCEETERIYRGEYSRKLPRQIQSAAHRKLIQLDISEAVEDLRMPPGNQLKALTGNRKGQYSIRINNQWRLCFKWKDKDAYDAEIIDYH